MPATKRNCDATKLSQIPSNQKDIFVSAMAQSELERQLGNYNYIRFTVADLNGVPRGKVVPSPSLAKFTRGISLYAGLTAYAPNGHLPLNAIKKVVDRGHPSSLFVPDFSSIHPIPWAGGKECTVAEVFGELQLANEDGILEPMQADPRSVALRQLNRLDNMGLRLLSGIELEFKILNADRSPIFEGIDYCCQASFAANEDLLFELENQLRLANVSTDAFHTEYSPGQIEFCLSPCYGINGADHLFIAKQALREICKQKGYIVNFMAKPDYGGAGSGAHFNCSLWDKASGRNAFHDASDKDRISELARNWVAGLLKHIDALSALCAPSVNCYRRFHQPWAPHIANWGIEDRDAAFRVKNATSDGTLVENRLPSGVSNPYIVMAATIAAGLDGITNKLQPPPQREQNAKPIPSTLSEALTALENDTELKAALGEEFVQWFVGTKREIDLTVLKDSDVSKVVLEHIEAEVAFYEPLV